MTAIIKSLPPRWQFLLPYLIVTAAVFIAYANAYDGDFVFDDGLLITRNLYLHDWSTLWPLLTQSTTAGAHITGGFYRPLQMLLYFVIYQLFGETPAPFHLLNIAIHAANACLMLTLGKKLNFNPAATLIAALIWALHPIHTEAVTYMSATADPLFAFFCLLGLILLLPDFSMRKIMLSIPIFLLALLSKETAIVFPLLVLVTFYYTHEGHLKPTAWFRTAPLWLVMAGYLCWRLGSTDFDGPATYERFYQMPAYHTLAAYAGSFSLRLYTFFATLPAYLDLLVWPHGLHMERDFPVFADFWDWPVLEGTTLCLVAAAWILFARGQKALPLGWGFLWFAAAHAPDTGLFVAGNAMFLEHWMYLPTVGMFLGGGESLWRLLDQKRQKLKLPLAILGLAAAVILGFATFIQNMVWHDPITFYTHIFKNGDQSARAHNNIALAYMDRHEYPQAIAEFHKAISLTDVYAETHHNLALCLLSLPDQQAHIPEAIDELNKALAIDPNFIRSYVALARIYNFLGDHEKAESYQNKANELLKGSAVP